jgi:CubicO group peptidase (beta-lactamase class C family)
VAFVTLFLAGGAAIGGTWGAIQPLRRTLHGSALGFAILTAMAVGTMFWAIGSYSHHHVEWQGLVLVALIVGGALGPIAGVYDWGRRNGKHWAEPYLIGCLILLAFVPRAAQAQGTGRSSSSGAGAADDGYWKTIDPAAAGLNVTAFAAHQALCERTGADACLVVYHGRIAQEWYSARYTVPMYAMSSTKSVAGLLVGMLIDDGRIKSIDEPVCAFIVTWCSGLRAKVTLRHLLSMTSGLPMMRDSSVGFVTDKDAYVMNLMPVSEPGTTWAYSNEGAQLLSPILDKAAGEPIQDYARKRLFGPLGMRETRLHVYPDHAWTYADMETTARDFARLGLLMLGRGMWQGHRIVSERWLALSTRPSQTLNPRYGLLWWIDPEIRGFAAHGHLDTDLHIIPDLDLVIVRMQLKPVPGVGEGTYEREGLRLFRTLVDTAGQ